MPTTTSRDERVQRSSADPTRERILAAALDVFADRSFDGAATREIAARAEVTQGLLNYHFHSKEELWKAAVDELFEELERALTERATGLRGVDDLTTAKLLVREFVHFSARRPQLHRIITGECKADGPRMDWLVERHTRALFEMTTELIGRLVEQGSIAPIPPAHAFYILTGAAPAMFVLGPECRRLTGLDPTADDVIEAHGDAVVRLLFGADPTT